MTRATFRTPGESPSFLSQTECAALTQQIMAFARGGGTTIVSIDSTWTGNVAWTRNRINTCGDVRDNEIKITRSIRGANNQVAINQLDGAALESAVRRAERLLIQVAEYPKIVVAPPYDELYDVPLLWFDRTYQLNAAARAEAMRALVKPAEEAGMFSAGYIAVRAHGRSVVRPSGHMVYHPFTTAQYSVTVRDPKGTASGWAGVDFNDWGRIDVAKLSAIALQKCLDSRNPTIIEPGRYVTILEPQAVCDLVSWIFSSDVIMDRRAAEAYDPRQPFSGARPGESKIGQRVIDERLTVSADPMDPDCGFVPINQYDGQVVYHPVKWIEHGVLKALAYKRDPYGIRRMGLDTGLPNSSAFRMTGGTTSVEEMITTTKRGLLVTRFWGIEELDHVSVLLAGYTRDGVWLIENGKISKPVKNFRFTESPLFVLNNVVQLGAPQRVFRPGAPVVVPPLKVQDFSFSGLADAV